MKRLFDIVFSILGILILFPFLLIISLLVLFSSPGGIFFSQERVGKDSSVFRLLKFRTMRPNTESLGQITVGTRDPRITGIGFYLRKFKLDELPQLFNILGGSMSFVGPRPEVPRYVSMYSPGQLRVLSVRPGLTDLASLEYFDENELLGKSTDPEKTYISEIMPAKLKLNLQYIDRQSLMLDLQILWKTLMKILRIS